MTAFRDPFIDPAVHRRIEAELDAIEREYGVRILLAVESGSRAWRFPSRDSDYDVRFLYLRPIEDYLTVVARRDVIERPIDATLDVGGWDLRKALQLLIRSNAVLIEWLESPVRYRVAGEVSRQLLDLARSTADPAALAYHYEHQARRSMDEIGASGDVVRLKTYCYALRSAFALSWVRRRGEPPPMDLPSLMEGLAPTPPVSAAIADLLARKAAAIERDTTPRLPILDAAIADALAIPIQGRTRDRSDVVDRANALFASIVLRGLSAADISPPAAER